MYAHKLGTTEEEVERIITTILRGKNVEDDLLNFIGYDGFDDVAFIIQNKDQVSIPNVEEIKTSITINVDFVEIKIPSQKHHKHDKLVSINALSENDRKYFKYNQFNPVQSRVFHTAYNTNRNFLVSAPTGCGKTDIALVSILRAIKQEGKIVFIVPMKALATEITFKLKNLFKSSIEVLEFTGDMVIDADELHKANILIATPEKFDVSTRKLNSNFIISLLIIDEIHILHDRRGSVIESIVCRMFRHMELHQRPIRIVGLSATLPNYEDVAKFIKANDCFDFDSSFRPVPLEISLIGIRKDNNDVFENTVDVNDITEGMDKLKTQESINLIDFFNKKPNVCECSNQKDIKTDFDKKKEIPIGKINRVVVDLMSPFLENNKQILVFVTSRRETERTKHFLENKFLTKRFGIHHAGLSRKIRLETEKLFRDRRLDVLVTTSTLAWGVNLPARCVIIKGTQFYSQETGGFQNLNILDVLQIFGRSGRPQYDDLGFAYLITENAELNNYYNLIRNRTSVESKLLFHFTDILNTEIYLNNIRNLFEAIQWMKSTYLFIRMLKAPLRYGFTKEEIENKEIDKVLADYINIAIRRLSECGLIETIKDFSTNDNLYMMACEDIGIHIHDLTLSYNSTFLGRIASFYFISHETIFLWLKEIETLHDEQSILELIFSGVEFNSIVIREDESQIIKQCCTDFDVEYYETPVCKMFILFCLFKMNIPTYSMSLSCDQTFIIKNLERLIVGLREIVINYGHYGIYETIKNIEILVRNDKPSKVQKNNCQIIDLGNFLYIKSDRNTTIIENDKLNEICYITHEKHFFMPKPDNIIKIRESGFITNPLNHIKTLYKFGIHNCSSVSWTFFGYKNSCPHFHIINDLNETESICEIITDDILLMEHCKEFTNDFEDTKFDLFFNRKYSIEYNEIDCVEFRERQKLMTRKIVTKIESDNVLIVVPNRREIDTTANDLNTLLVLKSDRLDAFNIRCGMKRDGKPGVIVAEFYDVLKNRNRINEDALIFFKGIQSDDLYCFYDILKVIGANQCVIFETANIISFYGKM